MKRPACLAFLTAAFVGGGHFAAAKYTPPDFYDLAGGSDAVVVGEIVKVDAQTFSLRSEDVLAGSVSETDLVIVRFKDWTCASRWKPYAVGQREVAFLYELPPDNARQTRARYGLRSAGDEAEWEIRDDRISVHEGGHPPQWRPLDHVVDAIRSYRSCFSVSSDPSGQLRKMDEVRVLCDAPALEEFRGRSPVHDHLAKTSLEASRRARSSAKSGRS